MDNIPAAERRPKHAKKIFHIQGMKQRHLEFLVSNLGTVHYIRLPQFSDLHNSSQVRFFFFTGFTLQFLTFNTELAEFEFGLTIAALPLTVTTLMASTWFVRRENKAGMLVALVSLDLFSF
jgi:hypothetical protein